MKHDYRILRHYKGEYDGEKEYLYMIHEVYYNDSGAPISWTQDGSFPLGEDMDDFKETLSKYNEALQKPVLDVIVENNEERLQESN